MCERNKFTVITRKDIVIWISVCTALPVLFAIVEMAFYKEVQPAHPQAELIRNSLLLSILLIPPLCGCLQWYSLRRFARDLRLWAWLPAGAVSWTASLYLAQWISRTEGAFEIALMHWRMTDSLRLIDLTPLFLSLGKILACIGVFVVLTSSIQSMLLGVATSLPARFFLIAAVAGGIFAGLIEQLCTLVGIYRPSSLNGLSWERRFIELSIRASFGASYGIASCYILLRLLPRGFAGSSLPGNWGSSLNKALLSAITVALCVPATVAVAGRDGGRSALATLRKSFTRDAAADQSQGEAILTYSHLIDASPGRFPVISFSPDSRTFLVLDDRRQLLLIDVSTGQRVGPVAEPLALYERYDVAWSPDSQMFAVRTRGGEEQIPGTQYSRFRPRIRTYTSPTRTPLNEYQPAGDECHESSAQRSLIFAPDARSIWMLCEQYMAPQIDSLLAIQLNAASLEPLSHERFGGEHEAGRIRTLGVSRGQVVYLQHLNSKEHEELRVGVLGMNAPVLRIQNLLGAGLADGLLAQWEIIEQDKIIVEYCGVPTSMAGHGSNSICRTMTLDAATGKVNGVVDEPDKRFAPLRRTLSLGHELRIEGILPADSKRGEMEVRNSVDGRVRQRLRTFSQLPLAISPDQRWLITFAPERKTLNAYRVAL